MKRQTLFALGAASALALGAFTQLSPIIFSDEFFERVDGIVRIGPLFGWYYAKNYGSCTWDATHDVQPCIDAAITAARSGVTIGPDFFRNGGGKVKLPPGNFGIATAVLQIVSPGIDIEGVGGPGSFGYCKTSLTWIGSAGGTMVQFGNDATGALVGGGLQGVCLKGESLAGKGIVERSHIAYHHRDVSILNVTSRVLDINVSALDTNGNSDGDYDNIRATLDSVAAASADGLYIGDGTATNDTFDLRFRDIHFQYQNGIAYNIGASDTLRFTGAVAQTIVGGTGRSLQCRAGATVLQSCRANIFQGSFGSSTASTAPIFKTGAFPALTNYLRQNTDSGALVPVIESGATLCYETDKGDKLCNGSTSLVHGGMAYKAAGTNGAVFDIDTANSSNFAVAGKFGPSLPVYLLYSQPIIGFNEYWKGGGNWGFGKGSVAGTNYGGKLTFATTTGVFALSTTTATGVADANATDVTIWRVDRLGHVRVSDLSAPGLSSCGTSPAISGDDRAGEVTMGTGTPTGCVISFANVYAAVPYCTVSWQATPLASQSYAVSTTAITLTQTATSSNKINYSCTARSGG